jgi:hypothetical protein
MAPILCTRLSLAIRRCHNPDCGRHLCPYRPEGEGYIALPKHAFGLDVNRITHDVMDHASLLKEQLPCVRFVLAPACSSS